MAAFDQARQDLDAVGAKVVAASIDPPDRAQEVAAGLSFPVGHGVTRTQADQLGSWWEDRRGIIQPSEFIVDATGKVRTSTYSAGPIGRFDPADVVKLIQFYEKQAQKA